MKIREPLPTYKLLDGVAFVARSNSVYQILSKTNNDQSFWNVWRELTLTNQEIVRIMDTSGFFRDKIIYVREKE